MDTQNSVYASMRRFWVVWLFLPFVAAAQQPAKPAHPPAQPAGPPTQQHQPAEHFENGSVAMPDERAADSYAIYSMLVPGPVLQNMPPGQTQSWAIADTTISTEDRSPSVPPQGQLKPPPGKEKLFEEAIGDFEANQHVRIHLTRNGFHLDHAFTLLAPDQVQQLRDAKTSPAVPSSMQTQWGGYPGVTFFSEVYFDKKHTAALVYQSEWCAHLCSAGTWIYLEKQGNRWVRQSGNVVPGA